MTDRLPYWLDRLAVMEVTTCVELTAKEAGELRALLESLEEYRRIAAWTPPDPDDEMRFYGPVTPEPLPIHEAPTYTVATTAPTLHVFPGDGSVHEVRAFGEDAIRAVHAAIDAKVDVEGIIGRMLRKFDAMADAEESSFAWLCGTGLSPDPNQATPAARCAKPYGHKGPCRPETDAERSGRLMVEAARNRHG